MSIETTRGMVDSIVSGNLNKANAEFETVLQMKREAEWENAILNLAHTAFDDITPEETYEEEPAEAEVEMQAAEVEEE